MTDNDFTGATTNDFIKWFKGREAALAPIINALDTDSLAPDDRKAHNNTVLLAISRLGTETREASANGLLPSYDAKWCSSVLDKLRSNFEEIRERRTPAPKFSFKRANKDNNGDISKPQAQMSVTDDTSRSPPILETEDMTSGATTTTTPSSAPAAPVTKQHILLDPDLNSAPTLSNLSHCVISTPEPSDSLGSPASLTLRTVDQSLLVLHTPISGPAYLSSITNTKIFVKTRQFRMYQCRNVDVYLYCDTIPVIEESREIRFSSWPHRLRSDAKVGEQNDGAEKEQQEEDGNQNDYDDTVGHVADVQDFNWLSRGQSPNWKVLDMQDRIGRAAFDSLVHVIQELDEDATNVESILREAGVSE